MIRRAVFASFFVLVLSAANVLAATKTVSILASSYSPASVTVALGGSVQWKNTTGKKHTVTSDATFLWTSIVVKPHKTSQPLAFKEAGTFAYHDSLKAGAHGSVVVPMMADAVDVTIPGEVMLTLGTAQPTGPVWHQVEARLNGGTWSLIATTEGNTTGFQPSTAGTWELQTRLHQGLSGGDSGWSPIVTITAE